MAEYLLAVVLLSIEAILLIRFLNHSIDRNVHSLKIFIFILLLQLGRRLIIYDMGIFSLLPSTLTDLVVICFSYDASLPKKTFLLLLYYAFQFVSDFAVVLIISYLYYLFNGTYLNEDQLIIYSAIPAKILLALIVLRIGDLLKSRNYMGEWLKYLPVLLFIVVVLARNYDHILNPDQNIVGLLAVLCICCFLINLYMVISLQQKHTKDILLERIKTAEQNKKLTEDYHLELQRLYKQVDHVTHDLKYHLDYIEGCEDLNDIKHYVHEIKGRALTLHNQFTGNLVIDMNLNALSEELGDIVLHCYDILPLRFEWINHVDMSTIIGNSVSNAIEACKIHNTKEIILSFSYSEDWLLITVENQISHKFKPAINPHGFIISTKKDSHKKHGIGMDSMQASIARYGGAMHYETINSTFRLDIMLQNQQAES